ncbi:hypothetical protein [Ralstonia mannitolilytica]|uniref:Uncharacterized protein n=1 Tax=Ralstonia mannitolilytica TaxID=105219 RepID=A0AAJ4ZJG1_9RALS|nr:hypothetical protein [Ralstonia mannitolilytica]CAG2142533.1 hypothetical protein LMG6866_02366 [Ralstonia mannitolilytica]SUD86862.1 Uncharacterised protein [Ralstonia mannitolilytica]SUD96523.1 Uncharacterised protein [Ralstonia mannitolilytica]
MSHGDWDKELVALRTRLWKKRVKEEAGFEGKRDQDFIDACKYGNTKLVELGEMNWDGYLSGRNNPVYKTVDAVEKVLPGTALNFYFGPKRLFLWGILHGDGEDNLIEARKLLESALTNEYGSGHVQQWDLGQKVFWFILPILAFPVAPFVEQMTKEKKIVDGEEKPLIRLDEELPWSDIQHLVDSGAINPPMNGEEIFLSSLLAVCDDTRKLYTLENIFTTFGTKLVGYAFDQYKRGQDLSFSAEFIVTALGLLPLAKAANNNRIKSIAKTLIEGLMLGAIDYEIPELAPDLTDFVKRKIIS